MGTAAVITVLFCYGFVKKQLGRQKCGRGTIGLQAPTPGSSEDQAPSSSPERIQGSEGSRIRLAKLAVRDLKILWSLEAGIWWFDKFGTEKALTKIVGQPGLPIRRTINLTPKKY
ncbi:MAG TPA: hypothetical protein VGY56_12090 [Verrucomicrobiae bacterium]|nr:hypothetical protein [Verrucomicrobiae bacterium]